MLHSTFHHLTTHLLFALSSRTIVLDCSNIKIFYVKFFSNKISTLIKIRKIFNFSKQLNKSSVNWLLCKWNFHLVCKHHLTLFQFHPQLSLSLMLIVFNHHPTIKTKVKVYIWKMPYILELERGNFNIEYQLTHCFILLTECEPHPLLLMNIIFVSLEMHIIQLSGITLKEQ